MVGRPGTTGTDIIHAVDKQDTDRTCSELAERRLLSALQQIELKSPDTATTNPQNQSHSAPYSSLNMHAAPLAKQCPTCFHTWPGVSMMIGKDARRASTSARLTLSTSSVCSRSSSGSCRRPASKPSMTGNTQELGQVRHTMHAHSVCCMPHTSHCCPR